MDLMGLVRALGLAMIRSGNDHGGRVWDAQGERSARLDFSASIWPHSAAQRLAANAVADLEPYPDFDCRALVAAAARFYGVEEGQILAANGSTEALFLAMHALRPRSLTIFEPTFSEYLRAAQWSASCLNGSEPLRIHHVLADAGDNFRPRLEVPSEGVAVLCNPNNPTGALVSRERLRSWLHACEAQNVDVIVDEAFMDFVPQSESLCGCLEDHPNLLVLRSFTKCFGVAGLRLGFLLGPERRISALRPLLIPWSVSTPAQRLGVALAALSVDELPAAVAHEREWLASQLTGLGWRVFPSAVNFLLCSTSEAPDVLSALAAQGVLLRDASNFYGLDQTYLRCAVRSHEENEALLALLRRQKEAHEAPVRAGAPEGLL